MNKLKGKVAFITGAGSSGPGWGNGKAVAFEFAKEGATVAAIDVNWEAIEETRQIIEDEGGICISFVGDVTDSKQVSSCVKQIKKEFGQIDILHNNVGIFTIGGPVEASEEDWDHVMAVNLKSMFLTCKFVIPIMLESGGGSIINVSSTSAHRWQGTPYISYAASKAGILQFTRAIAVQYAQKGIRANILSPGLIDSPLVRRGLGGDNIEEAMAKRNALCPMGRMGTTFEVAKAALFLASDDASYVTGAELVVDGGLLCRI